MAAGDGPSQPTELTPQPLAPPALGACSGSELGAGLQPGQAEGPGLFSAGLSIQDFLPTGQGAEQPEDTGVAPVLEEALQTIGSDLRASASSATAGTGCSGPQEYDFRSVLRPALVTSAPGSLQTMGGSLGCEGPQLWGDTHVFRLDTCVPDGQVALPHPCPPRNNLPQEGSSQAMGQPLGHVSEGGILTGGYASGMAPSRPRWNIHGHVSDASIKVGENVWDVASSRPRWNVHGHVSQSQVMLGAPPGETQPDTPRPLQSSPDDMSQPGLSLGTQSPTWEHGSQLLAEPAAVSSCTRVAGSGEEGGLQALPGAEAGPSAAGDSTCEPGQWDSCPVTGGVGPGGGGGRARNRCPGDLGGAAP